MWPPPNYSTFVYMRQVERFEYVLLDTDGVSLTSVSQMAIDVNNVDAGPRGEMLGLTSIDTCRGETTCVIATILVATFYQRPGVVSGSGVGTMQFGTDSADAIRRLQTSGRSLQTELGQDIAAAGDFDISFQIDR